MVADEASLWSDPDLDDERRAVERARAGDLSALEPVLARHAGALLSQVLLPRLGERAAAEDLLRETFVTALARLDTFTWQGPSFFFWLRRIALNKLIDLQRGRARGRALVEALAAEAALAPPTGAADDAFIAEEERRRALARIEAVMSELPPRYARAIRLRLIEERPRDACAAAMGVEMGNFDVILFRAVRAFRAGYGDRE